MRRVRPTPTPTPTPIAVACELLEADDAEALLEDRLLDVAAPAAVATAGALVEVSEAAAISLPEAELDGVAVIEPDDSVAEALPLLEDTPDEPVILALGVVQVPVRAITVIVYGCPVKLTISSLPPLAQLHPSLQQYSSTPVTLQLYIAFPKF